MRQYKVGDTVTIRSWESMGREFGDCRDVPGVFIEDMREMCGTVAKITGVIRENGYLVEDCNGYFFSAQMFTDWETDNKQGVDKMKLQYEGQEVECITEGYWPEGVTLLASDDEFNVGLFENAVCLRTREDGNGVALAKDGCSSCRWKYWAIKPTKPAPRRLTNREAYNLWRKGWDVLDTSSDVRTPAYCLADESSPCYEHFSKLRAPGSDEWLEPTTALLEVGKC